MRYEIREAPLNKPIHVGFRYSINLEKHHNLGLKDYAQSHEDKATDWFVRLKRNVLLSVQGMLFEHCIGDILVINGINKDIFGVVRV